MIHPSDEEWFVADALDEAVANREAFIKALYDALDQLAQEARSFRTRLNHMLTHPWCYK